MADKPPRWELGKGGYWLLAVLTGLLLWVLIVGGVSWVF